MFTPVVRSLGLRLRVVDDTRDYPVARVGGWSVWLGASCALILVGVVFYPTGATLLGSTAVFKTVGLGATAIFILGVVDDFRPLAAGLKLGVQVVVAVATYAGGLRIDIVSWVGGSVELGVVLSAAATVVWLVGISNAFNLLDGADGVATGSAFFSAAAVFIMSVLLGHPAAGLMTAALAGALLGFLPFNLPPARVFLGDSGSLLVGFVLAGLAVEGSTKGPTLAAIAVPLVAFAVPVFDTFVAIVRRVASGRPLFERDDEHVHHRLSRIGLGPMQVVAVLYAASAAAALLSMLFINTDVRAIAVVLIVVGGSVAFTARILRLHELNELARVARRGLRQPKAIRMNVQLRRAAERLERVESFEDICDSLGLLFADSEFDQVLLVTSDEKERRGTARCFALGDDGTFSEGWPDRVSDEWEVTCPFPGAGWRGELRLRRRLGRNTLLMDLNLLLEVVQPALSRAGQQVQVTRN
jgi:UDP-GlcNAc:undecaprenyl-phosphate GlcNAc-1-phosphate transferase